MTNKITVGAVYRIEHPRLGELIAKVTAHKGDLVDLEIIEAQRMNRGDTCQIKAQLKNFHDVNELDTEEQTEPGESAGPEETTSGESSDDQDSPSDDSDEDSEKSGESASAD